MADPVTHGEHDPLRVAEAVDRGARLGPVLDLCTRCLVLYADLRALAGALSLSAVPARPRSFTLTAEDARRLRPGGWRGLWSAIGSARDTVTRPLAIGMTTLGIAGLLLTASPTLGLGLNAGTSSGAAELGQPAAASPTDRALGAAAAGDPIAPTYELKTTETGTGARPTLLVSVGLLGLGGGLFIARRLAGKGRPVR